MKLFLTALLFLNPALCRADTFLLKDGARLEGEVTGETEEAVLVKTKYGSLTINRADIQQRQAAQPPAATEVAPPAPEVPAQVAISTALPEPAHETPEQIAVSTALPGPAAVSTATVPEMALSFGEPTEIPAAGEGLVGAAPKLTFQTIIPSTMTRLLVYCENGVAVATETYDSAGVLAETAGAMPDGTYTEYYPDGGLKTVRTMMGGKANGTLKAFYPSGAVQVEAYYFVGGREGAFKYFTEDGKPLMEAEYSNDRLNGWKTEYGPGGEAASRQFYADGLPALPPGAQQAAAAGKAVEAAEEIRAGQDSQITVNTVGLARGERFEFRLNGKFLGRARLDREFNVISLDGKFPDGEVKAYGKDGRLQKEFVFEARDIKLLRVYGAEGELQGEYSFEKGKAVKK